MSASDEALAEVKAAQTEFDLGAVFRSQYARIARIIGRVVRDSARAEELAVEVFLKLSRSPRAQRENTEAWLYRVAVRTGLDELRRSARRSRYEHLVSFVRGTPTPEEILAANQEQERVRRVLCLISPRQAELLLLRSQGLTYDEVAAALKRNPASIGTLLSRAQDSFRKEYIKLYGPR
ncbi:MAG TPA: sigma-70 family RNA polymerase sigma factor [Terriglobales bacterium]